MRLVAGKGQAFIELTCAIVVSSLTPSFYVRNNDHRTLGLQLSCQTGNDAGCGYGNSIAIRVAIAFPFAIVGDLDIKHWMPPAWSCDVCIVSNICAKVKQSQAGKIRPAAVPKRTL
jgi:hypothetical protein